MPTIKLYEYGPSRAVRARWTLQEADMPFEAVSAREIMQTDECKRIHPLGLLPAVEVDGKPLFESAAICTWIADQAPEKELIAAPGSWESALHDQWSYFAMTEVEAYLWSSAQQTLKYEGEAQVMAIVPQNNARARTSIGVIDDALDGDDYLVDNRFSVTDIIVAFTLHWARSTGLTDQAPNVDRYLDGLYERHHCPLGAPD